MNAAEITALSTGIPAILAAVTALVSSLRSRKAAAIAKGTAVHALNIMTAHVQEKVYTLPSVKTGDVPHD